MSGYGLRLAALAAGLLCALACDETTPCDRYVDYMCTCHAEEPGFDCEELSNVYSDAGGAVENQCAIELEDQRSADEDAGLQCDA